MNQTPLEGKGFPPTKQELGGSKEEFEMQDFGRLALSVSLPGEPLTLLVQTQGCLYSDSNKKGALE